MKMIDLDKKCSINSLSIYLTPSEAKKLCEKLNMLLRDPEACEHFHIYEEGPPHGIPCSIITEKKLRNLKRYNKLEQEVLGVGIGT